MLIKQPRNRRERKRERERERERDLAINLFENS